MGGEEEKPLKKGPLSKGAKKKLKKKLKPVGGVEGKNGEGSD